MKFPKPVFQDGSVKVKVIGELGEKAQFGIDNVKVVANYECSCVPNQMIAEEDFETYPIDANGAEARKAGWRNGKIDHDPSFTNFLGRFGSQEEEIGLIPVQVFDVTPSADIIVLEFDFYEIDAWKEGDFVYVNLNGERIDLGTFSEKDAELTRVGTTKRGIEWMKTGGPRSTMGFGAAFDEVHRVSLRIPPEVFATGQISLEFEPHLKEDYAVASAGFDNIKIMAEKLCEVKSRPPEVQASLHEPSGCTVIESQFSANSQCSMGSFGAEHVSVLASGDSTVEFKLNGHDFPADVSLNEIKLWFLDPENYDSEDYHKCWSGVQDGLFAQQFVAKCEDDGWATIRMTGGEDEETHQNPRFHQMIDVEEPFCSDRIDHLDYNPLKRCFWELKIPCGCVERRRAAVEHAVIAPPADPHDCGYLSRKEDSQAVQVDKCTTVPPKDAVQIVSQDLETVTFAVSQKWKGCDGSSAKNDKLGWIATDYINKHGDLICETDSNLACGMTETFTAHCTDGIAVVDLYAYDEQDRLFGQTDGSDMAIPLACNTKGRDMEQSSCHFRYILKCKPSLCNKESSFLSNFRKTIRRLGGSKKI